MRIPHPLAGALTPFPGVQTYPEKVSVTPFRRVLIVKPAHGTPRAPVPTPTPFPPARIVSSLFTGAHPLLLPPAPSIEPVTTRRLVAPDLDTSVELEMKTANAVRALLIPEAPSQTVAAYLESVGKRSLPSFFQEWLLVHNARRAERGLAPRDEIEIKWDETDDGIRENLLAFGSARFDEKFFHDRKIPGVRVSPAVFVDFAKPTVLFGRMVPAGKSVLSLSDVVSPKVEYEGPGAMQTVSGVEIHVRRRESSGTVSRHAFRLLEGLGLPRVGQHVHIPAKLPFAPGLGGRLGALRLAEFHGRVNVIAEIIQIVRHENQIWRKKTGDDIHFGPLTGENLENLTKALLARSLGIPLHLGSEYKIAYVGFRGEDFYDQGGLIGMEYRAIVAKDDPEVIAAVLDAIQWSLHKADYGITPERFERWLRVQSVAEIPPAKTIARTYHNHAWSEVFANAPGEMHQRLGLWEKSLLRISSYRHSELKMLIHDWGNDPLFFDDFDKRERILTEQRYALERILRFEGTTRVVRDFLIDSGLYEDIPASIGVQLPAAKSGGSSYVL